MASTNISLPATPVFTRENYVVWSTKVKAYFQAYGLWEVVESSLKPPALPNNPTISQIRQHSEKIAKKGKALTIILLALFIMYIYIIYFINKF